jgi:hypothetical protein
VKNPPQTVYFDSLIDDFGIWQHTDGQKILYDEGYALDDAARGLLVTLVLKRDEQSEVLWSYILKSKVKTGGLYGFSTADRQFLPQLASDDAVGQVIWAAGLAIKMGFHRKEAQLLINQLSVYLDKTEHMRGFAYALLGAIYVNHDLAIHYYDRLRLFFDGTSDEWPWPEQVVTYGNGIMPYAFLRYGIVYGDSEALRLGRQILLFIEARCTDGRSRGPIGNEGWLPKNVKVAPNYSQQPIDAAYMIWAWLAAYQASHNRNDMAMAKRWASWFDGNNVAETRMYDLHDGRCFDGIDAIGVHRHSGAESNICLLLSQYMLDNKTTI